MIEETTDQTFHTILTFATTALLAAAFAWALLNWLAMKRRRALNLTTAETVRQEGARPGFLSVDHEKRAAALDGGAAFDAKVAARDAPPPPPEPAPEPVDRWRGAAKAVTILFALVTLLTGIVGALMRVEFYDAAIRKYGAWENTVAMVSSYPIGFCVALGVVGVTGFNFYRTLRA